MLSSHQIHAMAMQQQQMFSNNMTFAQQLSPPGGMFGGYGGGPPPGPPQAPGMAQSYGGAPQGGLMSMAAQLPYQMPGQYTSQGFSEQLLGTGLGGLAGVGSGMANIAGGVTGAAGMATMGASLLGMGGALGTTVGFLGGPVAMGGALALGGAAYGGEQLYQGFRERQDVNRVLRQRFGGQMGVGSGRGGMGFSGQEMGEMSTMMRGMAQDDMFTNFDELTRTLDKTSQMGLFRGTQGIKEFQDKFRKTVDTLKEVAKTMHTSLDEAAGLMESQRNQGFYSGSDVSSSLMRTRLAAGASGMSIQQMDQIGRQGTMMGRSMGMLGRTGSDAMKEIAANYGVAMQMGVLSDEDVAEATGGLTGAAGAQALAARSMQGSGRFMKRGAGRAMLAGMWDQEGGMDEGMLSKVMAGEVSFREVLSAGRKNIRETGGRRSEFFLDEERLRGQAMAEGGGDVMIGMLGKHVADRKGVEMEDPIVKRWLMRQTGKTRSEIEVAIKQFRAMPEIMDERRVKESQQLETEGRARAREVVGFQGFRRKFNQTWDREVSGRLRQAGDDAMSEVEKGVDDIVAQLEGRIVAHTSKMGRQAAEELRMTGKSSLTGRSHEDIISSISGGPAAFAPDQGVLARTGRALGMRAETLDTRLADSGAYMFGEAGSAALGIGGGGLARDATLKQKTAFAQSVQEAEDSAFNMFNQMSGDERTGLEESLAQTVAEGGAGRGKNLWEEVPGVGGDYSAGGQMAQRILGVQRAGGPLAGLIKGKTFAEQTAILQQFGGRLEGSGFEIKMGGVGTRYQRGARSRALLAQRRETRLTRARKRLGETSTEERREKLRGGLLGLPTGLALGTVGLKAEMISRGTDLLFGKQATDLGGGNAGDVEGVLGAIGGSAGLARQFSGLAGAEGAISAEKARTNLSILAAGGALPSGADLDLTGAQRATLGRIAEGDPQDMKRLSEDLLNQVEEEGELVALETRKEQATTLGRFFDKNRARMKEVFEDSPEVLEDYEAIVRLREEKGGGEELREKTADFMRKHGHTEAAGDLLTVLQDDPAGAFGAVGLGMYRRRTENLLGKGQDVARGKAALFGSTLEGRLGVSKKDIRKLGGRNQLIRQIQSGDLSGEDLIKMMKDKGISAGKGVTGVDVEREIESVVGGIASGGGFDVKEMKTRGMEDARRAEEGQRSRGGSSEMNDLPDLAAKQVQHLKTMVKLTQIIASKQTNIQISVDKKGKVAGPGGKDVVVELEQ